PSNEDCLFTGLELHFKVIHISFGKEPAGGLEITVIAGRVQSGAPELSRDVFCRKVQPLRRSVAALKQIRGDEREMASKRVTGNAVKRPLNVRRDRKLWSRRVLCDSELSAERDHQKAATQPS